MQPCHLLTSYKASGPLDQDPALRISLNLATPLKAPFPKTIAWQGWGEGLRCLRWGRTDYSSAHNGLLSHFPWKVYSQNLSCTSDVFMIHVSTGLSSHLCYRDTLIHTCLKNSLSDALLTKSWLASNQTNGIFWFKDILFSHVFASINGLIRFEMFWLLIFFFSLGQWATLVGAPFKIRVPLFLLSFPCTHLNRGFQSYRCGQNEMKLFKSDLYFYKRSL